MQLIAQILGAIRVYLCNGTGGCIVFVWSQCNGGNIKQIMYQLYQRNVGQGVILYLSGLYFHGKQDLNGSNNIRDLYHYWNSFAPVSN